MNIWISGDVSNLDMFNPLPNKPLFLQYKSVENTVGKGEIAHNKQFLLFPLFSTLLENFLPFTWNLELFSTNSFSLEEYKICRLERGKVLSLGKELLCISLITEHCYSSFLFLFMLQV